MEQEISKGDYRAASIDLEELVRHHPHNVALRIRYADVLLHTKDYVDAVVSLREAQKHGAAARQVTPRLIEALVGQRAFADALAVSADSELVAKDPKLLRLRGESLLGLQRDAQAREEFTKAIALNPRDARSHLDMGAVLEREQGRAAAKSELDKALEFGPDDYSVQVAVGSWHARSGEFAAAREHLGTALALARTAQDPREESAALGALGDIALELKDAAAAKESLRRLEQLLPQGEPTRILQARLALSEGRPADAERALREVVSGNAHSAAGNLLLGMARAAQGDLAQAESYLSSAITADPNDMGPRKLLADIRLREGKAREALDLIGSATSAADGDLLSIGGRASLYLGNPSGAIEYFERGRNIAASDTSRTLDLAEAYLAAKRNNDAVALLRQTSVPDFLAYRRELLLVTALSGAGKRREAAAEARQFAVARSADTRALIVAGQGLWAAGDPAGAREMLQHATHQDPKAPAGWTALGALELSQGDGDTAAREFTEALRLQPTNVEALLGQARIALGSGRRDEAIRQLEAARRASLTAVEPRLELARLYLAQGDGYRLDEIRDELRRLAPNAVQVRTIEAATALARRQAATAISAYQGLVADFPAAAVLHAHLARAYLLAGRLDDARRANRKALVLNPHYWPGNALEVSIGILEDHLQDASDALARLRAISAAPRALVLTLEGDLAMRKAQFASAAEAYSKANAASPSSAAVLKQYAALAAARSGDRRSPLREWLKREPQDASVRIALAMDVESSGDTAAASREYATVLKGSPDNVVALNNLAWLRLQQGAIAEGLELAGRAYGHNSHAPEVADTYGWALLQSGRVLEALPVLWAAEGTAPTVPSFRYHLATALAKSGSKLEAERQLEAIVGPDSHFSEQDAARTLLASLRK